MFKKFQFLFAAMMCVTAFSAQAVLFTNGSSQQVILDNFSFVNGFGGDYMPASNKPVTLQPNQTWKRDDVTSLSVLLHPEKPKIEITNLKSKSAIILHANLTHTREDAASSICTIQ